MEERPGKPWDGRRRRRAVPRALVAVLCLAGCLGAVAYAAAPRRDAGSGQARGTGRASPRKPVIGQHPDRQAVSSRARFSFTAGRRTVSFRCRLDRRSWQGCRSPLAITGLTAGPHSFAVRALDGRGRRSRPARFRWQVLEPRDFSITPDLSRLGPLYPGAPAQQLPLTIANPNPVPIRVTSLEARATAGPPGCPSAENLVLAAAGVSSAAPLVVAARGSTSLPAAGIASPTIQLRDLPVNQDACQGARFPLTFSGSARG